MGLALRRALRFTSVGIGAVALAFMALAPVASAQVRGRGVFQAPKVTPQTPVAANANAALIITTLGVLAGLNQPVSFQFQAAGGTGTYVWSADSLPDGLSLSPSGLLTGVPTQPGILPMDITVKSGTETVRPQPQIYIGILQISNPPQLIDGEVDSLYVQQFFVFPIGDPVWSIVAGNVPDGVTFDDGLLYGTPTTLGLFTFTVQAIVTTDLRITITLRKEFQIRIGEPPPVAISGGPLPYGGVGQPYSTTLVADGGNGTFTWTANSLAPGLSLSADGVLSGAPTAVGTYPINITATSGRVRGTAQLALIVVDITTPSILPAVRATAPYLQQLRVTTGFVNWSLISGSLPPGIAFTSQGALSGTAFAQGNYSFRARAVVDNIVSGAPQIVLEKDFALTVAGPPVTLMTQSLCPVRTKGYYSQQLQATGGDPPYVFSVSGLPPGLSLAGSSLTGSATTLGTYSVVISVRDSMQAEASRTYTLEVKPPELTPKIQVSPGILRFEVPESGELSAPQELTAVSTTGELLPFTMEVASAPWLKLSAAQGTAPAIVRARAQGAALRVGDYSGAIRFLVDGELPVEIPVLLSVVAAHPAIEASPGWVRFTSSVSEPRTFERLLVLDNLGGGGPLDFQTSIANRSTWITAVTAAPAVIGNGSPAYLRIRVDSQGLREGSYRDVIHINSRAGSSDIPVTLFVAGAGPQLSVSARGVRLTGRQAQGSNPKQTVEIFNSGEAGSTVAWVAEVIRGADIFTLTPATGEAQPGMPSKLEIGLKDGIADIAGAKSALIRISDPRSQQSPRYLVAVADIAGLQSTAAPQLAPAGLLFSATQNGAAPLAQSVELSVANTDAVRFSAAVADEASEWLSVGPGQGVVRTSAGAQLSVAVKPGRLGPGVYTGTVNVAIGSELRAVNVTFVVGAPVSSNAPKALAQPRFAGTCTPTRVALAQTALISNFSVPAGWPVALTAKLADDCGAAILNGSVVAHFSNGDAPLMLENNGFTGDYTGTWQPIGLNGQTVVRFEALASGLAPATVETVGEVQLNLTQVPSLTTGLLNNLNPQLGAALAPGGVTQIFGSNLSPYISRPGSTPLPTTALGIEAIIGGIDSPLYYMSPAQLNIQVPYELAPNHSYSAVVVVRDAYSLPEQVDVVPVQPGLFTSGGMMAFHADGQMATPANPAILGEELSAYLVGMGATTPLVESGKAAPKTPLASVASSTSVIVGGQPAVVTFQGLAPGQVGLYQVNFRVPSTAPAGEMDVVISQDGVAANPGKMPIAQ